MFATFDVLLRRQIFLNRSCAFEILKFQGQQRRSFRIPSPNFEIPLPGCSQIPFPVKISRVFPNPTPCFIQILHPENTLPDPVSLNPGRGGGMVFKQFTLGRVDKSECLGIELGIIFQKTDQLVKDFRLD